MLVIYRYALSLYPAYHSQKLHREVSAALEDVEESYDVAVEEGIRIDDRISDPRMGGKIDDDVRPVLIEQLIERSFVRYAVRPLSLSFFSSGS